MLRFVTHNVNTLSTIGSRGAPVNRSWPVRTAARDADVGAATEGDRHDTLLNGHARPKARKLPSSKRTADGIDASQAAIIMAPRLRSRAMFVPGRGWFCRDSEDSLWHPDNSNGVFLMVNKDPARQRTRKGTATRAIKAELEGLLTISGDELDVDDMTCGLPDGRILTLDDGTYSTCAATADDLVTMALGVVPEESKPELWLRVLTETFAACIDPLAVMQYFRWWFRHALSGDCSAEVMLFLHGPKGSGKSTVADTLLHIFGDYGVTVAAEHLVGSGDYSHHRAWLARLDRKRLVRVAETPAHGGTWKTPELLALVSGETLTANWMRQNPFDFRSQAHVLCTGNHAPHAPANSGYWRRLRLLDCRSVPEEPDIKLKKKLLAEAGKILHWALTTSNSTPLTPPEMTDAADDMRATQDPLGEWITEHIVADPNGRMTNEEAFALYLKAHPDRQTDRRAFGTRMSELFGATFKASHNGRSQRVHRCRFRPEVP